MQTKKDYKKLFSELEKWSKQKDSYSIDDFLKERRIPFSDFELITNRSKKFMKIWDAAESQAWENLKDALFKKSLSRSRIAEYIIQSEAFQGDDPEEIMRNIETGQARFELYLTAIGDTQSLGKYGRLAKLNDIEALMKCSLERRLITEDQYLHFLRIQKDCEEYDSED
jgi:hypothetical protein